MGKPWFNPKRYGYGAGLPCSWEGWAVLAAFMAIMLGGPYVPGAGPPGSRRDTSHSIAARKRTGNSDEPVRA